jgi:hypothetical protein
MKEAEKKAVRNAERNRKRKAKKVPSLITPKSKATQPVIVSPVAPPLAVMTPYEEAIFSMLPWKRKWTLLPALGYWVAFHDFPVSAWHWSIKPQTTEEKMKAETIALEKEGKKPIQEIREPQQPIATKKPQTEAAKKQAKAKAKAEAKAKLKAEARAKVKAEAKRKSETTLAPPTATPTTIIISNIEEKEGELPISDTELQAQLKLRNQIKMIMMDKTLAPLGERALIAWESERRRKRISGIITVPGMIAKWLALCNNTYFYKSENLSFETVFATLLSGEGLTGGDIDAFFAKILRKYPNFLEVTALSRDIDKSLVATVRSIYKEIRKQLHNDRPDDFDETVIYRMVEREWSAKLRKIIIFETEFRFSTEAARLRLLEKFKRTA